MLLSVSWRLPAHARARARVVISCLVRCARACVYFGPFRQISALVKAGKTPILLHCRTAVRAIFGAATYEVLVAKTVSADKAIAGANLVGYSYKTTEDNTTSWKNFGGVLTSTYTTAAAATATTGASDATPPPPPKSTTAPLSRAVTDTATNSVKVTSGVVRAAVSGAGLVLAAVVGAALAL
jgi:hypothetical protein